MATITFRESLARPTTTRESFLKPTFTFSIIILLATPVWGQDLDATGELLKTLTEAPGPSAFEEAVREITVREFEGLDMDIQFDGLGSVLATMSGTTKGPRIMVTAHMDEVGLMVQYITADGFIRVKMLGGKLGGLD